MMTRPSKRLRADIVIDPFLGSGSRLIGCEKTGRRGRGLELHPLYVEVILRRYEAVTGEAAVLESTGETYAELAARRQREPEHRAHYHSDKGARVSAS
jgi:DNA modification methylase